MNLGRFGHKSWVRSLLNIMEQSTGDACLRDFPPNTRVLVGKEHINPGKWEASLGIYRQVKHEAAIVPELVGGVLVFPLKQEERDKKEPDILVLDKAGIWLTSLFPRATSPWITGLGEEHARTWQTVDGKKWKMFESFLPLDSAAPLLREKLKRKAFPRKPTAVPVTSITAEGSNLTHTFFAIKQLDCGDTIVDREGNEILKIQKNSWWRSLIGWGPKFLGITFAQESYPHLPLPVLVSVLIMSFLSCTMGEYYSGG